MALLAAVMAVVVLPVVRVPLNELVLLVVVCPCASSLTAGMPLKTTSWSSEAEPVWSFHMPGKSPEAPFSTKTSLPLCARDGS